MGAPAKNLDLHGNVPDRCAVALLLIDVINDLEFEGGDRLEPHALAMADHLAELARRAREADVPVIYANDNYGRWRSSMETLVAHATEDGVRGRALVERLRPRHDDYFVLKPKHSAFYGTTLDVLLDYLGARTLVLAGIAADNCVLFTASDAFLRDFDLVVPADCVASQDPAARDQALALMQRTLKARVCPGSAVDFARLRAPGV